MVREITWTAGSTPRQGRGQDDRSLNITGTPGYDWDAGYDGIQGFATQLRNRVSDPSSPQRRLSPRQMGEVSQGSPQRGYRTPPRAGGPRERSDRTSTPGTPRQGEGVFQTPQDSPKGRKAPPDPAVTETAGLPGPTQTGTKTPKQLLIYDETPTGRPLPTLRDIRQANLRKILEEEGADTPCDICGSPDHDY